MKIGILQADSVLPEFQKEHGDYPDMFGRTLGGAGSGIQFETYPVVQGGYPSHPDECDGYVITGSTKSVYDDEPWINDLSDYIQQLHDERKKMVGVCFGHQLVAQLLGGKTEAAEQGWGVGIHQCRVISEPGFMDPAVDSFGLLVSHKDQVTVLPPGSQLLATSEFCPNAMFVIDDHILALQGHPEFTRGYARALMQMRAKLLGEKTLHAGIESLQHDLDSDLVSSWIIRFIAGTY